MTKSAKQTNKTTRTMTPSHASKWFTTYTHWSSKTTIGEKQPNIELNITVKTVAILGFSKQQILFVRS